TETFGISLIEGLACGLPIAAYNVQGPKDIITSGVDGFLGEDLAKNAIDCLKLDPANCRKKAEQYSAETWAHNFLKNLTPIKT
ncbi:MAG TPA: glycosyltransferase, partial [Patescibacteria group bacterium]|nr:glycosyltransferase [Patescibacteria group bacterium]